MRTWVQHRLLATAVLLGASNVLLPAAIPVASAQQGLTESVTVDIPPQRLDSALIELSRQTGVEVLMSSATVQGMDTQGVKGTMALSEALSRLLKGTPLGYHAAGTKTISIQAARQGVDNGQIDLAQAPDTQRTMTDATAPADAATVDPGVAAEPTTESVTSAKRGGIEEIIVTARKRAESVQDVPISITSLSAEDLKTFGVRNIADMEGIVPGLNLGGGGNGVKKDSSPFIRGIGQRETKVTLDPAVATYIDGIYIGRGAGAMLDVTDVQNIQVLRGPQGTLFGRNATGGAISVTLQKPGNSWGGSISSNVGNYGRHDVLGVLNAPIIEDKVLGRLFLASVNSEGYFTNMTDYSKWGNDNRITGIGQLRILPTDGVTLDLLAERTRIRETPRPQKCAFVKPTGEGSAQTAVLGQAGGADAYVDGVRRFEARCRESMNLPSNQFYSDAALGGQAGGRPEQVQSLFFTDLSDPTSGFFVPVTVYQPVMPKARYWVDTTTFGGTAAWDIGDLGPISDLNLKSITAWRKTEQIADEDLDAIGSAYLIRIQPDFDETTQFSQELQIAGRTLNDRLFLSMGAYYFRERTPRNDLILSAGVSQSSSDVFDPDARIMTGGLEPAFERLQTDNDSLAWFGQADFDVTKKLQVTAGLRWTTEDRWSRYSKATVDPTSVVTGTILAGGVTQATGALGLYTAEYGLNPVLDWMFGSHVYSITQVTSPSSQRGNQALTQTFVHDRLIGDELSYSSSAWTPMFSVKYKADENLLDRLSLDQAMVYLTYSQGFHSGGVTAGAVDYDAGPVRRTYFASPENPCGTRTSGNCVVYDALPEDGYGTADPITFRPEKVVNYEIGLKTVAVDRRLQLNAALFYMDYTDMQTTAAGNRGGIPIPFIENVGKAVIQGVELEAIALLTPNWRIIANGSYTDADIKEWESLGILIGPTTGLPTGGTYILDRSDERMPRVPEWQFFALSEYNFELGNAGTITPSISARYTSSIYHGFDRGSWAYAYGGTVPTRVDPVAAVPGSKYLVTSRPTTFLDARIAWLSADGKMEAAVWGKNLTNEDDYLVGGIPLVDVGGATGQVYANPRTFGLNMTYNFGTH